MTICCTQVDQLLDKHLVEEAIILAETIAAVESSKHSSKAEQVCVTLLLLHCQCHVLSQPLLLQFISSIKEKAAMIMFCAGKFSQAEVLFHESNADPRKVGVFN